MSSIAKVEKSVVSDASQMYVTVRLAGQLFGVPVKNVRDVLRQQKITPIPLSSAEVAGSLNLRGRIVTVINLRRRLGLPDHEENEKNMFVVVEHLGDLYSLMVDSVGEVMTVDDARLEKPPTNMGASWKEITTGICKLSNELLVVVDVNKVLSL